MENKHLILTSECNYNDYTYSDYLEWCECNEVEPAANDSYEFHRWCEEETEYSYEADMENIKYHDSYNVPTKIDGIIGAWDGNHDIVPETTYGVANAIQRCIPDCMCTINVYWENGLIEVYITHHDGSNHFTISPVDTEAFDYLYGV